MTEKVILKVDGMKCMGCVANAEAALDGMHGMQEVVIDLAQGTATITGNIDVEDAIQRLTAAGYPSTPEN